MEPALIVGLFVVIVGLLLVNLSMTVVKVGESIVIFRLGRTDPGLVRGPGLHFVIPIIDRPVRVSLRETVTEASVRGMSRDEVAMRADVAIWWRIVDPLKSVVSVANIGGAVEAIAGAALHDLDADDAIVHRDRVHDVIEAHLAEALGRWGATLDRVEVRETARA